MKQSTYFYLLRRGVIGGGGGGAWSSTADDFQTRVEADGGTLESINCIKDSLKFLMQNP